VQTNNDILAVGERRAHLNGRLVADAEDLVGGGGLQRQFLVAGQRRQRQARRQLRKAATGTRAKDGSAEVGYGSELGELDVIEEKTAFSSCRGAVSMVNQI
jgi:hypothetical protein